MKPVCGFVLILVAAAAAQDREVDRHAARLQAWAEPLAQSLMSALPDPIDGLAEFAPWDYDSKEPPSWGCPVACTQLTPVVVQRAYVVSEPELEAKVKANEERAFANAIRIGGNPTDAKLQAAQRALEDEDRTLKQSVRRIVLLVRINGGPPERNGVERTATRAGEIAGHPVTRFSFSDAGYAPTSEGVRLVLTIGPETFRPTRVKDISEMKNEARTATVSVALQSRTATVKADEVLARQLLERVNFASIAKLLTP